MSQSSFFNDQYVSTLWSSRDICAATGGVCSGQWNASGISIDSRSVTAGELFIALRGDHGDGHAYVQKALDNGAIAAIVDRDIAGIAPEKLVRVGDTFKALEDLGRAARARTGAKIIGITGSVGKTGTKEMLGRAFASLGQTHFSEKSLNNHWGVPLSLARMQSGSDYGIFEMGMNHTGEIEKLTHQVRPHIAIITTIAAAHIEHFADGITGIARAKAEIFKSMDEHGIAIINSDIDQCALLKQIATECGLKKIFTFGSSDDADAHLIDCIMARNGTRIKARILGDDITFTLKDAGPHHAMNALSVLLAVKLLGGDLECVTEALRDIEPLAGRGKRELINIGDPDNPVMLIDESYNASPAAMQAAFKVMALIDPGRGGRRIAILGDMYELGSNAPTLHRDLALPIQAAGIDLVYTCGTLMKNLYDALPEQNRGAHRNESPELAHIVPDVLVPGDVVLVKGSRGGGDKPRMQVIVEALRAVAPTKKPANAEHKKG